MSSTVVMNMIAEAYGPLRNGQKIVGRLSRSAPRTSGRWLRREAAPSLDATLALARNDPQFRARLIAFLEQA